MIEQFLDVIYGQEVLTVHRYDDCVPDLTDENLRLVLDLHIRRGENLGVDTLRQTGEDVPPRTPDGDTEIEGAENGEDTVQDNVPKVGIKEEQDHVGEVHQTEQNLRVVRAENVSRCAEESVTRAEFDRQERQDTSGILDVEGQKVVGLDELGEEDEYPQTVRHPHVVTLEARITGCECLAGNITTRVLAHVASEEASDRHDREENNGSHGDKELHDAENLRDLCGLIEDEEDANRRRDVDDQEEEDERKTTRQVLGASPLSRYESPFRESRDQHDETGDRSSQRDRGPVSGRIRLRVFGVDVILGEESCRVVSREEPEHGNVDDPDTVEVDGQMPPRPDFFIRLEEDLLPVDLLEFLPTKMRGHVDETALILQDDALDTFGVPEKLVHVIVTDNVIVVALPPDVLAIDDLVTLIAAVLVERCDDLFQVGTFFDRLGSVLAFRALVVVVRTFEDEAETLGHKSDLIGFTPAKEEESDLSDALVLGHSVHASLPSVLGSFETVVTLEFFESLFHVLGILIFRCGLSCFPRSAVRLPELHVRKADGVIKVEVSSKVPFSVVGVIPSDVVGMEGQKGLVGSHTGCTGIQKRHEMVVHVSHAISLETKLGGKVHKDVLDFLLADGDLIFCGPSRVWLLGALAEREGIVVDGVVWSGSTGGTVSTVRNLR